MNGPSLDVHIDELVVRGHEAPDPERLAASVAAELARLRAGAAGAPASTLAAQIARALHARLEP